eukprot:COSAG05_NODE_1885_length_3893_cov_2.980232_3_plen_101_part_00
MWLYEERENREIADLDEQEGKLCHYNRTAKRPCVALKHAPWPEGTVVVVLRSARILVAEAVGDSLCLRADQGTIPVLLFENRNPRPTVPQKHSSTDMDSA